MSRLPVRLGKGAAACKPDLSLPEMGPRVGVGPLGAPGEAPPHREPVLRRVWCHPELKQCVPVQRQNRWPRVSSGKGPPRV